MLNRAEVLRTLAEFRTDEVVVMTMSAAKEWPQLSPSPLNLLVMGAMGFASSVGLGMALASPDKRVIVLDGDGSLMMNLGTLITISGQSPPNLIHFVLENGLYELPGRVALPGGDRVSLSAIARASGLSKVWEFDKLEDFREHLPTMMHEPGPAFVSLQVAPGPAERFSPPSAVDMVRAAEAALRLCTSVPTGRWVEGE